MATVAPMALAETCIATSTATVAKLKTFSEIRRQIKMGGESRE